MPRTHDDPGALAPEHGGVPRPNGKPQTLPIGGTQDLRKRQETIDRMRQKFAAISAEVKRIGEVCHQCSVIEDSPDADDCPFIKLCPGKRRRQIRGKTAKCHAGRWAVNLGGQGRTGEPATAIVEGCLLPLGACQ